MALLNKKLFLDPLRVVLNFKRFRGKINVQKPKAPHFERAKYLEVTKPIIVYPSKAKENPDICLKDLKIRNKSSFNNPLQKIYAKELLNNFLNSRLVAFYHANPMNAELGYNAHVMFYRQNMMYKNYGKQTVQMAVEGTAYEPILQLFMSHNMMVFSPEPEVKKLLKVTKKFPQLVLLAGILEGKFVSKDELVYYSNVQNLQTAQCKLVHTLNSIGGEVVSKLSTHQQILISQLSERMKQLENKS